MGFFSMNEHSNLASNFEFPVVEGYDGTIGCGIALVEGYQNDLALFTAAVQYDMSEMYSIKEGVSDEVLQEGAVDTLKRMWEAIKQFFIKLGAKIKALFTAFMAKIQSYFVKDTKAFVKKYEKNLNGKDFKDMKIKYSAPKYPADYIGGEKVTDVLDNFEGLVDYCDKLPDKEDLPSRSELLEQAYEDSTGKEASNASEYSKWAHEQCYEDEEVKDDWDYASIKTLASRLSGGSKVLDTVKKDNDKAQRCIKKCLDLIDKEEKRLDKLWKDTKDGTSTNGNSFEIKYDSGSKSFSSNATGSGKFDINNAQRVVSTYRTCASCFQEVVIHACNCLVAEVKFGIAQDKRVFTKAVGYKTVKEETLLTAIEECATDEVYEYFENPSIVA